MYGLMPTFKGKTSSLFEVLFFIKLAYPFDGWAGEGAENLLNAYMLSCPALEAKEGRLPVSVSLVQAQCQQGKPSNNLRIINRHREDGVKKGIAVCSKALAQIPQKDNSMRFIEWVELLRALGAEKIMIGVISVHPNLMKVSKILVYFYTTDN